MALPYLPPILLDALHRHPDRPPAWISPLEGTLLLADISGFTPMSERLAEAGGKEGAEWLTNIINQYFHRLLDVARDYRGYNVKFGGDALLVLFTGDNHAWRAVAAALGMQRITRQFKAVRVGGHSFKVRMSVAIHSGTFWSAAAGIPERRMQYFVLGREASRVAETETAAEAGEVVVTRATFDLLGGTPLVEARGDLYRVLRLGRQAVVQLPAGHEDTLPSAGPRGLLPFLPPPVVEGLGSGNVATIESEHRKVSIVFIHLLGVNELLEEQGPEVLLGQLNTYLSCLIGLADRYSGFLAGNDVSRSGLKLIVIFGAPVAHEEDPANALRVSMELNRELPHLGLELRHSIGINSGFVFAGDVGSPYRREYTVIGDAVNLSARLMGAASTGQIMVARQVADEGGRGFVLRELEAIRVKGKREPIPILALEGERAHAPPRGGAQAGALLGRKAELDLLTRSSRKVEGGAGRSVVISGEAGMGKSHLVQEFQERLRARRWGIHSGRCYSHTAGNPFQPWVQVLSSLFDISPEETAERRTEKVLAAIQRLRPDALDLASLLNGLLSLSVPESDLVRSLKDEARRRRLFDLILGLLQGASTKSPLAIVLVDLHWADDSSLQLVNHVGASLKPSRILLCLTQRPQEGLQLHLKPASTVTVNLAELQEDAAIQLAHRVIGVPELPEQVVKTIVAKARGNPLFIEEVARSLRQSGALDRLLSAPAGKLAQEIAALDIPDRIQALIMSSIDALGGALKNVLRTAAVIGDAFTASTLGSLLELGPEDPVAAGQLQTLVRLDLLSPEEDGREATYRFKQTLVQEIAYDSLSFARRRELHHRVGSHLESTHQDQLEPLYEVLVHHYKQAGDSGKTLVYAVKSAGRARQVYAHEAAIEYYRSGLAALERLDGAMRYQRTYLLERIGDCSEVTGRSDEAIRAFSEALREWRQALRRAGSPPAAPPDLAEGLPPKAREAMLCRKIGVSYERCCDYGSSLKWAESALVALPPRHPSEAAQVYAAKSLFLFRKGQYKEAIHWGQLGLAAAQRSGDRRQLAYAHNMLGNSFLRTGNLRQALRHRRFAVHLYEELGDLPGQMSANNNLGSSYLNQGLLERALHHFRITLRAAEQLGNPAAVAVVHNNIGEVLLAQGHLEEAVSHFRELLNCERAADLQGPCGLAQVNLSRAYQRQQEYAKAGEHLRHAMELLRKAGTKGVLAEARLQQAELELETGAAQRAWRTCRRGLREARELGMGLLEARGLRILGRVAQARGRPGEAEAELRKSIALAERVGAEYEKGRALLGLGQVYGDYPQYNKDSVERCRLALRQAASIFRRLGAEWDLAQALQAQQVLGRSREG